MHKCKRCLVQRVIGQIESLLSLHVVVHRTTKLLVVLNIVHLVLLILTLVLHVLICLALVDLTLVELSLIVLSNV